MFFFFFSSRRRHTRFSRDWSSDVCSSDLDLKRERRRGPLQGIPYGAKDLLACPGGPTAWGAAPYAGQVFDYRAAVIEKLDKAAAVLLGKLAMVELAGGPAYR